MAIDISCTLILAHFDVLGYHCFDELSFNIRNSVITCVSLKIKVSALLATMSSSGNLLQSMQNLRRLTVVMLNVFLDGITGERDHLS